MKILAKDAPAGNLVSYYLSGNLMRSRRVGDVVLHGTLDIPAPPARLLADWEREASTQLGDGLGLEPGDVESLSLPRARLRWPDYKQCVRAVSDWTEILGLGDALGTADVALMTCRGARYHHDAAQYGSAAFCNLFLTEDKGLDLHFPASGQRIALVRGTVVIFDTGQPHAVIPREKNGFDLADFPSGRDCSQIFLTWELPMESPAISNALGVAFDVDPATASQVADEHLRLGGERVDVCDRTGRWHASDSSVNTPMPSRAD